MSDRITVEPEPALTEPSDILTAAQARRLSSVLAGQGHRVITNVELEKRLDRELRAAVVALAKAAKHEQYLDIEAALACNVDITKFRKRAPTELDLGATEQRLVKILRGNGYTVQLGIAWMSYVRVYLRVRWAEMEPEMLRLVCDKTEE